MAVGLVAVHYPRPECAAEMMERVRAAADVLIGVPGLPGGELLARPGRGRRDDRQMEIRGRS